VGDPIHSSMLVNDARTGGTVRARVRDTVTSRFAWSDEQAVPEGRSYVTFAIGRGLPRGRYRAEASFANETTNPREFVVHDRGQAAPFR
jgi:hypothetical protein